MENLVEEISDKIRLLNDIEEKLIRELNRKEVEIHIIDLSDVYLEELIDLIVNKINKLRTTRNMVMNKMNINIDNHIPRID